MSACLLLIFFLNVYSYCSVLEQPRIKPFYPGQICAVAACLTPALNAYKPMEPAIGYWSLEKIPQAALGWVVDVGGRR